MQRILHLFLLVTTWLVCPSCSGQQRSLPSSVVFLGDSNTWLGGDSCNHERGWTFWFCQMTNVSHARSYARSGATWTHTSRTQLDTLENVGVLSDNNVVSNQVARLKAAYRQGQQAAPDLIMILAGTNDAWFHKKRPTAFKGGLRKAVLSDIAQLKALFPQARIVLLTPFQSVQAPDKQIVRVGNELESVGKRAGVEVVRLDSDKLISAVHEQTTHTLTYDGTHTTADGARRVAQWVYEYIRGS